MPAKDPANVNSLASNHSISFLEAQLALCLRSLVGSHGITRPKPILASDRNERECNTESLRQCNDFPPGTACIQNPSNKHKDL